MSDIIGNNEPLLQTTKELKSEFDEKSILKNVSKEQAEIDVLEWAIKNNEEESRRTNDKKKEHTIINQLDGQYKELQRLKDIKHVEKIKNLKESVCEQDNTGESFKFDPEMILRVYSFLIETKVYNCDVDEFMSTTKTANFKSITPLHKGKTKIKELIYQLQGTGGMGDEWYTKAVQSIGVQKKHCTNLEISDDWKEGLNLAIRPQKPKSPYK